MRLGEQQNCFSFESSGQWSSLLLILQEEEEDN